MWANHSKPGFTIVELLIVIVVIAIIAAISVVAYGGMQERARDSKRTSDFAVMNKAVRLYYADNGAYPKCNNSTNAAGSCTFDGLVNKLVPKYISQIPKSPVNPVNNTSYHYAWGFKKTGPMNHGITSTDQDYSIGTYLETKGCPCTGHFSVPINLMEGTT